MSEIEIESISDINTLFDNLSYDGFNPDKIRSKFTKSSGLFNDLILCLTAYSKIGNNPKKLSGKIRNHAVASEVLQRLNEIGINKKAKSSEDLTLPRLASAYMPVYLLLRMVAKNKLEVDPDVDSIIADICFCGCELIYNQEGYKTYYKNFSISISTLRSDMSDVKTKKNQTVEDAKQQLQEEYDEKQQNWLRILRSGYINDAKIAKFTNFVYSCFLDKSLIPKFDDLRSCFDCIQDDLDMTCDNHSLVVIRPIITDDINISYHEADDENADDDQDNDEPEEGEIQENNDEDQEDEDQAVAASTTTSSKASAKKRSRSDSQKMSSVGARPKRNKPP